MTRRALIIACRSLLASILAAMMVVPAYASHCPHCLLGTGGCFQCNAKVDQEPQPSSHPAPHSCCRRHETHSPIDVTDDTLCSAESYQTSSCDCCRQPHERTLPGERTGQDWQPISPLAPAPAGLLPIDTYTNGELRVAAWLVGLSPPRPHRILHCAWLI